MGTTSAITVHRGNGHLPARQHDRLRTVVSPVADVFESHESYILKLDLPGVTREEITVTITSDLLTISAESAPRHSEEASVIHREILWNAYSRMFNLGKDIDTTLVAAELSDGVLTVILPKHALSRPRTITIN